MNVSVQRVKETFEVIIKVSKLNKNLLLYSAENVNLPKKVISTTNLKSISVFNEPVTRMNDTGYYITNFEYQNHNTIEQVRWMYAVGTHNWEKETAELIKKTIELV